MVGALDIIDNVARVFVPRFVPVFMLHRMKNESLGIDGTSPEMLEVALEYFQSKGYVFVSLSSLVEAVRLGETLPRKAVCFTLDDGFSDQFDVAFPIFRKFNCPATFFVATSFTSGKGWLWHSKVEYLLETTKKTDFSFLSSVSCSWKLLFSYFWLTIPSYNVR